MRSATDARPRGGDRHDTPNDTVEVSDDVRLGDTQHRPAQRAERAIPRGVMTAAPVVRAAVDLDDQTHLGACEVDDVIADDELTTKRKAGARTRKLAPEPLFTAREARRAAAPTDVRAFVSSCVGYERERCVAHASNRERRDEAPPPSARSPAKPGEHG